VVSTIDNFIRPRLVGQGAKLHDLLIFFSSLGGIVLFGVMGFIVGPVVAALFVAVLDIYSREFEQQLKEAH
jgi:predicted PurR-regulated permease PerM